MTLVRSKAEAETHVSAGVVRAVFARRVEN